ncbi:peptide ABC transporter substrate-binding protein [Dictyobacter vulcani]|uniref:Peptide ABC transporter substrate-binding protein n=1 Tax=Dictyobacter vulcani TaxID=2607529 RepID=A0A5J4KSU4_9CHLR|nr:ABC transporter permease [Dictyobacter vulcani]GER90212.1 peptide ABC transporter substrate-binding protein [Dictyobacter vulcani]
MKDRTDRGLRPTRFRTEDASSNNPIAQPGVMAPDNAAKPLEPEMAPIAAATDGDPKGPRQQHLTPFQESFKRFRRDKKAMISLGVIIFLVLLAIVGPPIYQHIGGSYNSTTNGVIGPDQYHSFGHAEVDRLTEGPSAQYWLGTDGLGRDILARLMQGVLISIAVAVLVEIVDIVLGIIVGVLAGYYGGWIDFLLARFTDIMFAFPGLLFLILISGIMGPWADKNLNHIPIIGANGNARLLLVSLALAFTIWPLMARYVRGQTLQLKQQQYVEAAKTLGSSDFQIILRHIIPNLFSIVVIASTLNISNTIISEAGISFLGLGVQPPGSSIGLMVSEGSQYIRTNLWVAIVPCTMLAIIVLAFSFLGDGVRDSFDPRAKD